MIINVCFIWQFCGHSNNFAPVFLKNHFFRGPPGAPKIPKDPKTFLKLWLTLADSAWLWLTLANSGWLLPTLADSGWPWITLAESGWVCLTFTEPGGLWLTQADSCQLWKTLAESVIVSQSQPDSASKIFFWILLTFWGPGGPLKNLFLGKLVLNYYYGRKIVKWN